MKKYRIIITIILVVVTLGYVFNIVSKNRSLCSGYISNDSSESRIYLASGSIYVIKSDSEMIYHIVPTDFIVHVTEKRYCDMKFYDSESEAQTDGYKLKE